MLMKKLNVFYVSSILLLALFSCSDDDSTEVNQTFFEDLDNDGIGNENVSMVATEAPDGYVLESGDFDDNNIDVQTIEDASLALLLSLGGTDTYALETYVNPDVYIQHNQTFGDGVGTVIGAIQLGALAGTTYELSRVFTETNANEDGDTIVVLHGIYGGTWNSGVPQVAFDVFRFDAESGLVEEHWDNLIIETDPLIDETNGNTQLGGTTILEDEEVTEANKTVVSNFINDVLVGGMWSTLGPDYFNDSGDYIQHSAGVDNGIEYFADLGDDFQKYDSDSPRFLYGEGNFVLAMSQGNDDSDFANVAFYDLFRLEDGKIVEHWDIIENILQDGNPLIMNTNGKW